MKTGLPVVAVSPCLRLFIECLFAGADETPPPALFRSGEKLSVGTRFHTALPKPPTSERNNESLSRKEELQ
jgi:hypothetical protein